MTNLSYKTINLSLSPEDAADELRLKSIAQKKAGYENGDVVILRRSIDARRTPIKINIEARVGSDVHREDLNDYEPSQHDVANGKSIIIIGAGPAGLFAAIQLIEFGIKPILLERGKDVRSRRRDLAKINREGIVDEDSNYCFGEGGAGTYSDGKLYTRSKKRGDVARILKILHHHGAHDNILYEAHPHIGTNKLPKIIQSLREYIIDHGGEVRFDTRVTDLIIEDNEVKGVRTGTEKILAEAVILATGHSARDIYKLLYEKKIKIEPKSFAMGVRVEHPQELIDSIQYHQVGRGDFLPAAAYSVVCQVDYNSRKKGVFSFCMCPGGFIVPASTSPGEVVVNGMSPSRRNSKYANSGIVVAIDDDEVLQEYGDSPLRYMHYQEELERRAYEAGGGNLVAPAQRLTDFVNRKLSTTLPDTSYKPGGNPVLLNDMLPEPISKRLSYAFRQFDRKMKGYLTNEAILLGVESRTSSPVRIPRTPETLEHVQVKRLFPAGEGAGYAGGIVSAAIDGENCAKMAALIYFNKEQV